MNNLPDDIQSLIDQFRSGEPDLELTLGDLATTTHLLHLYSDLFMQTYPPGKASENDIQRFIQSVRLFMKFQDILQSIIPDEMKERIAHCVEVQEEAPEFADKLPIKISLVLPVSWHGSQYPMEVIVLVTVIGFFVCVYLYQKGVQDGSRD